MYCFAVMKLLMHVYIKTVQRSYPILKTNRTGFRKRRLLCDSLSNLVCYVALDQKKWRMEICTVRAPRKVTRVCWRVYCMHRRGSSDGVRATFAVRPSSIHDGATATGRQHHLQPAGRRARGHRHSSPRLHPLQVTWPASRRPTWPRRRWRNAGATSNGLRHRSTVQFHRVRVAILRDKSLTFDRPTTPLWWSRQSDRQVCVCRCPVNNYWTKWPLT